MHEWLHPDYYYHPYQVYQCQVLVDVHLLRLQNKKNLVTKYDDDENIKYCCCDKDKCSQMKTGGKIKQCEPLCDMFFNVKLSECQHPSGCFTITTFNELITDSPSNSSSVYHFSFIQSSFSSQVSHCMCIYLCDKFWTLYICCTWFDY